MFSTSLVSAPQSVASATLPLAIVASDLQHSERIYDEALAPFRARFGPLLRHLQSYRGKRLRSALVMIAGHACGKVSSAHHVLGAVVEMIHTATLVHDDVLDEAVTRRHASTINAAWNNKTGLLLGDMLFSAAFRLCSTVDAKACEWIGAATNRVCAGELAQVLHAGDFSLTEDLYFEIVAGKTGALTECCTLLGAHYAGAAIANELRLAAFGRSLGIAFQIIDDVLDLTGDESNAGKSLGTDIAQGKLTLPLIRALAELNLTEAAQLRALLSAGAQAEASAIVARTGAIESARLEAQQLIGSARQQLAELPSSRYRSALDGIAQWVTARDR